MQEPQWSHSTNSQERLYVIGDIHGQILLFQTILDLIKEDLDRRPADQFRIILLGDLIDRGENPRGVLDIAQKMSALPHVTILRGNHEEMALMALNERDEFLNWRRYGGLETLSSFGLSTIEFMRGQNIDALHEEFKHQFGYSRRLFLENLPFSYQCGDYFFCHAGIRPGIPLREQSSHDLAWIREPFLSSLQKHEKIIIHGHSPVERIEFKENRINIDTGAYLTGRLTCLVLEGRNVAHFSTQSHRITNIF